MPNISAEIQNGVYEIGLNRPHKLNALNADLLFELTEVVREAKQNSAIRSVLLYGEGEGFCAGGDLTDFGIDPDNPIEIKEFLQIGHEAIVGLYNMEKPVITSVHGPAVGAGCNLAFACDVIVADESATFSEIFAKVGALPDLGGLYFLPQKIGMHKAAELIFTGEKVSAPMALEYGLINEMVTDGQSIDRGRELASMLASGPTKSLGMAKRIMHQAPYSSLEKYWRWRLMGNRSYFKQKILLKAEKHLLKNVNLIFKAVNNQSTTSSKN
ncbi:enoyl-CoA hydratase/isomerase family protein [Lentibacillus sp. N15]|uniref:enoyl-CoA hydratase/isomerase family protein n=1 Tax=Lentibacillus songyuanensis TaxID=3136161 RepID=UPI0031BA8B29